MSPAASACRQLREWQGQALEAMSQDLQSRQGSPPPGDASPAPFSKSQHPLRLRTTPGVCVSCS